MNLDNVVVTAIIAGKKVYFYTLNLKQAFNKHHNLDIIVDYEELDKKWMDSPAKMFKLIGEEVNITFEHRQSGSQYLFIGLITHVAMMGRHGSQNYIHITCKSLSIKLEGQRTMDSFMDKSLDMIVKEAVANSGNGAEIQAKPAFQSMISYMSQHNENCFEFLNRLSFLYSENFLDSGTGIYFGQLPNIDESELVYDVHITNFHFGAQLVPPKFNRYHYFVNYPKEFDTDAPEEVGGVRGYIHVALDRSKEIYTSEATLPLEANITTIQNMDKLVEARKSEVISHMLVFHGESQSCQVKIGGPLKVKLPDYMDVGMKTVETFLVTEVEHIVDQDGRYRNTFTGIPFTIGQVPVYSPDLPIAGPQLATVKDNADEKGRVKVQFQWQKKVNKTTNWIPVHTMDAGVSPHALKNRGTVFIPEKGDMVRVDFLNNDPDFPFVSGSVFPVNQSSGGGNDNNVKTIITKSGHTLRFNDCESGDWGITIKDRNGDFIEIDTKQKNIRIKAMQDIHIQATNITIEAEQKVELVSGKDIRQNATENLTINSRNMNTTVKEDYILNSKTIDETAEKVDIQSVKQNMTLSSKKNVEQKSGSKKIKLS